MSSQVYQDDEWQRPRRDERGRFAQGSSGNYAGRPRKHKPEPKTGLQALQYELAQEIVVTGPNGPERLKKREVLLRSAVNDALMAKAKERWAFINLLTRLGALDPTPEELDDDYQPIWCEAERQLIEEIARECGLPNKPRRYNIALARWEDDT